MEETPAELQENLEAAGQIVREQMDEFFKWLDGKELIPRIQEIKENAVNDFNLRIMKPSEKHTDGRAGKREVDECSGYCNGEG